MLNNLMKRKSDKPQTTKGENYYRAPVDVLETDNEIKLIFDIPGADKNKIDVRIDKGTLTLTAESLSSAPEKAELIAAEYCTGHYTRSFTLPDYIDTEKVDAAYQNGVLSVTLPKREEVKPKSVSIKVS